MGRTIYQKRSQALAQLRAKHSGDALFFELMDVAREAVDLYISTGNNKTCRKCGDVIGSRNKTGYCRNCRRNKLRQKDSYKKQDARRAREYRLRNKLRSKNERT